MLEKAAQVRESLQVKRPTYISAAELEIQQEQELAALVAQNEPLTETEGAPLGIETSETIEAAQEGQAAPPAAGTIAKGKRGRPSVPQKHVVAQNPEGGFEHVTDGAVTATYKNRKQATVIWQYSKSKIPEVKF
jgi:hypothetical protein